MCGFIGAHDTWAQKNTLYIYCTIICSSRAHGHVQEVVLNTLEKSAIDPAISISVSPEPKVQPKQFVSSVIGNMYFNKGVSGSSPTSREFNLQLCINSKCFSYLVAQDSRDSEMYWVSYITHLGIRYPLGFTRLTREKI